MDSNEFIDFDISVPWGQVSCRWYGNRLLRPLLAIHGWMDNIGSFGRLIPLPPKHLGVLCIELPGHGRSSHYPAGMQYSVYEWTSIIRRVVLHFKWSRVFLMGHSFGAVACNLYASFYGQDHVDMLIAIDLLIRELNSRIRIIPYMVIKASNSNFINDGCIPVFEILRKQNPQFEHHLAQGAHHVLISDPEQLAAWIAPFIRRQRPVHRWEDPGQLADSKL